MRANQTPFRIAVMARVLGVFPSGFYAWRQRGHSARERCDETLTARVRAIHAQRRGSYGAPRIHAELAEQGLVVSRKRVARMMRQSGLAAGESAQGATYHTPRCPSPSGAGLGRARVPRRRSGPAVGG